MKKELWVPYCLGNMLDFTYKVYPDVQTPSHTQVFDVTRWRLNDPFLATMTYDRVSYGRSAVTVTMRDDAGHTYPMIGRYFFEIIHLMNKGSITGYWKAIKRGTTYGLVLVDDRDIPNDA